MLSTLTLRPVLPLVLACALFVAGCAETTTRVENNYKFRDAGGLALPGQTIGPEERILELQASVLAEPDNPKNYFDLGTIYEQMGKRTLAIYYYRELVNHVEADRYTGPYYRLGRQLALESEFDEAIVQLERCVNVQQRVPDVYWANPDYREGHFLLGTLYHERGDTRLMVHHYKEFLRFGGEERRIQTMLAKLLTPNG